MTEITARDLFAAAIAAAIVSKQGLPPELGRQEFCDRVFQLADAMALVRDGSTLPTKPNVLKEAAKEMIRCHPDRA